MSSRDSGVLSRIPMDLDKTVTNIGRRYKISKKEVFKLFSGEEIIDIKKRGGRKGNKEYVDVYYKKTFLTSKK